MHESSPTRNLNVQTNNTKKSIFVILYKVHPCVHYIDIIIWKSILMCNITKMRSIIFNFKLKYF